MHTSARSTSQNIRAKLRSPEPFKGLPGDFLRPSHGRGARVFRVGFEGSLGTVANTVNPPPHKHPTIGADSDVLKRRLIRAESYALLAEGRRLLLNDGRDEGLIWHHKIHRTAGCQHIPHGKVHVHHSSEYNRAFFSGVQTCGSIWGCPVCAAKISERRRLEVEQAVEWAWQNGYQPVMVTLTFPHQYTDDLGDLLDQQSDALRRLRRGQPWAKAKKRWGYQGCIRALEVTHGQNGWHPHTHELWLVRRDVDAEGEMLPTIKRQWRSACERAGLLDRGDAGFDQHAVDVKGNCSAGQYLAKQDDASHWGVDREIAKASSKGTRPGKRSGRHPFGLLADSLDGDERAGRLYVHFLRTVTDRRCRALLFSPGLKRRVGIDDLDDIELAQEQREEAEVLGRLYAEDWRLVRSCKAQSAVLDAAELGGWDAVILLLGELARSTGSVEPQARRRPLAEVRAEAEAEAVERQQDRQEQAVSQAAMTAADAALAEVRRQSVDCQAATLADAEQRLKAWLFSSKRLPRYAALTSDLDTGSTVVPESQCFDLAAESGPEHLHVAAAQPAGPSGSVDAHVRLTGGPPLPLATSAVTSRDVREARLQHRLYVLGLPG